MASTGYLPIRAPLTIDDDDDDEYGDFSSNYDSNVDEPENSVLESAYSTSVDSGSESEGYMSGQDSESASESPFVADPSVESRQGGDFVDKGEVFRPFVQESEIVNKVEVFRAILGEPNVGSHPGSDILDEVEIFRPFGSDPSEENHQGSNSGDKDETFGPFVASPDVESVGSSVFEEESGVGDEFGAVVGMGSGGLDLKGGARPIARLSLDEDDYLDSFSALVKVPYFAVLDTVDSSAAFARVKQLTVEEDGNHTAKENGGIVPPKLLEAVNSDLGSKSDSVLVNYPADNCVTAEITENSDRSNSDDHNMKEMPSPTGTESGAGLYATNGYMDRNDEQNYVVKNGNVTGSVVLLKDRNHEMEEVGKLGSVSSAPDVASGVAFFDNGSGFNDQQTAPLENGVKFDEDIEDSVFQELAHFEEIIEQSSASYLSSDAEGSLDRLQIIEEQMESVNEDKEKEFLDLRAFTETAVNDGLDEEEKATLKKMRSLQVKFLRLVRRAGYSLEDTLVLQVLCKLAWAANQDLCPELIRRTSVDIEVEAEDYLDFSLNILVVGKTGVGKSATINSIFGEERALVSAFEPETNRIKEITGTLNGVNVRVIDTPGLRNSGKEESYNWKILASIKKSIAKHPPDVVLYVDRLDDYDGDVNHAPLFRLLSSALSPSIWRKAVIVLTHAASPYPDGPFGNSLSFKAFVAQRSHLIHQAISNVVGDPIQPIISLIENCRKGEHVESAFRDGESGGRSRLLILCYTLKILSEARTFLEAVGRKKLNGYQFPSALQPCFLSSLFWPRCHPKLNGADDIECGTISYFEDDHSGLKPLQTKQLRDTKKKKGKETRNSPLYMMLLDSVPSSHTLVRPLSDLLQWDCALGYFGVNLKYPGTFATQIITDKGDFNASIDTSICVKRRNKGSAITGYDTESIERGRDHTCTDRSETLATGVVIEDRFSVTKHITLIGGIGAMSHESTTSCVGNIGVHCKKSDGYPIESLLCLSMLSWPGDYGLMARLGSEVHLGRDLKVVAHVGMRNPRSDSEIKIRCCSSRPEIALIGIVPMLIAGVLNRV